MEQIQVKYHPHEANTRPSLTAQMSVDMRIKPIVSQVKDHVRGFVNVEHHPQGKHLF